MSERNGNLSDKVALITGAASGIGRVIAGFFAQQGISVVIADFQKDAAQSVANRLQEKELQALSVSVDLRKETEIQAMVDFTVGNFGRLDILINSARPRLKHMDFSRSLQEWDTALDVLLKAPALTINSALPALAESGSGSIVNIGSTLAFFIAHQPLAYHVAKAGLLQLTRYLACELASKGIRVNAICPSIVDLPEENRVITADAVNRDVVELSVPLGRASSPEEIAETALFFCKDASSYITGQILSVDGGLNLNEQFHIARKSYLKGQSLHR